MATVRQRQPWRVVVTESRKSHPKQVNHLYAYLRKCGIETTATYSDGAVLNPVRFPLGAVETEGAVLFADLPGFTKLTADIGPVDAANYASHFFAWFEGEAGRRYGGIVDKFIGDEVMMVFPPGTCEFSPLRAALLTARAMLSFDPYAFYPKLGVASGSFAIAIVGTEMAHGVTVVGNAVNLATRCVAPTSRGQQLRVASSDRILVDEIFVDQVNTWEVDGPLEFEPKNMANVDVIDITYMGIWLPNFDPLEHVRKMVEYARDHGAVCRDPALDAPGSNDTQDSEEACAT